MSLLNIDDEFYLTRIKRALGLTDNTKDDIISDFILMYSDAICLRSGAEQVPQELWYILVEVVIARYNRIGSEHLKAENVDVVSQTYHDEILLAYEPYFTEYKKRNYVEVAPKLPMAKFL